MPFIRSLGLLGTVLLLLVAAPAGAQQVQVEQGVRAAGLWAFPIAANPKEWVYIPAAGRLATDDEGRPEFSFLRYAMGRASENAGNTSITQADGGGILHFLVLYDTPQDLVEDAQQEIRRLKDDDEIVLVGPVVFDSGRYNLVSSILTEDGENKRAVLATGAAPVLEGNALAMSFELDPDRASLLMESFQMDTPDISIVFDLEFSGLADAYDAQVFVDWEQMRENKAFEAGGSIYFIGASVKAEFDRLTRNNSIRMVSAGSDANTEALVARIYEKLIELLFEPVQPERVPEDQRGGLMDALSSLGGSSESTTGFGIHAGYQIKDMRSEGTTMLDFNHRASVKRHAYVTFNIGNLFKTYGDDDAYFKALVLDDDTFRQRDIRVSVDGALLPEFDDMVNNVTVTLRKTHAGGEVTMRELVIDKRVVNEAKAELRMVYGWRGDDDREEWLNYDYRTRWSFKGGGQYETEWTTTDAAMIDLFAPYQRRSIQVVNAGTDLAEHGVRAVIVGISYPFFGRDRREQEVIRADAAAEQEFEITLPLNVFEYDYRMTWVLENGDRPSISGSDGSGLVFLDPPPKSGE